MRKRHCCLAKACRQAMAYACIAALLLAEATLLFGRGMRAGIDRREQKKKAADLEADMLRKVRPDSEENA